MSPGLQPRSPCSPIALRSFRSASFYKDAPSPRGQDEPGIHRAGLLLLALLLAGLLVYLDKMQPGRANNYPSQLPHTTSSLLIGHQWLLWRSSDSACCSKRIARWINHQQMPGARVWRSVKACRHRFAHMRLCAKAECGCSADRH